MILKERVGLKELQEHYLDKLKQMQKNKKDLNAEIKTSKLVLEAEQEVKYYSNWLYAAVRILSDLPSCQKVSRLSEILKVSRKQIIEAGEFLSQIEAAKYQSGKIIGLKKNIHLDKASPFTFIRQQCWRLKALDNFQRKHQKDYYFNALMTLDQNQVVHLKNKIESFVKEMAKESSGGEEPSEALCLNIDFFQI